MNKSSASALAVIGSIVGVIVLLFFARSYAKHAARVENAKNPRTNREVALSCTTDMATQFHIHPHLDIVINGQKQTIPSQTGIELGGCMHPLHTHDESGKIHIESPEARDFTLADFFAVWGKTFNKDQILDSKTDDRHVIRVTVNGKEVNTYEDTILHDGEQVVISYEEKK